MPNSVLVMVAELYKYVKNHCTVYLKLVHFIVCKLHLNKRVNKRFSNSISVALASFLGSKITADGDCSHEIKIHLLLGRKAMTNLDSILKSRDMTLPTKVRLVKAMGFPVVMCRCKSWTIKKAEH